MDKLDKETDNISLSGIILPVLFVACLYTGGILWWIAAVLLSVLVIGALTITIVVLFNPIRTAVRVAVVVKGNKESMDTSLWDKYITTYENRMSKLFFWSSLVIQLALLTGIIHYGTIYLSVPYAVLIVLTEVLKCRVYSVIKLNIDTWKATTNICSVYDDIK